MRIFLDTNVLLDAYLNRAGKPASLAVLDRCRQPDHQGWIAWHTLSNSFYIVRRTTKSRLHAQRLVAETLQLLDVAKTGSAEAIRAEKMNLNDFEDALQIVAAEACLADVIVTRNVADFSASPLPVFTPEDFLRQYP